MTVSDLQGENMNLQVDRLAVWSFDKSALSCHSFQLQTSLLSGSLGSASKHLFDLVLMFVLQRP